MKLLAIETSTEKASVALRCNAQTWYEEQGSIRQHAQFLLPMIEQVLTTAGMTLAELDGIAFGAGPGSFTGLRITCSIAKALGYAHDLPLYPVSSLLSVAQAVAEMGMTHEGVDQLLILLDARMHQLYWANFSLAALRRGDGSHTAQVAHPADIVITDRTCIVAGVGYDHYIADLPNSVQSAIIQQHSVYPHALQMLTLVERGLITATSATAALPLYVRNQVTHGGGHG